MKARVLFVIEGDPRVSGRPAEAVRIAAGVAVWKKIEVSIYLRGPSVLALAEQTDILVDGDMFSRFLPGIAENSGAVYAQAGNSFLADLGEPNAGFEPISDEQLGKLIADYKYVLRFADNTCPGPVSTSQYAIPPKSQSGRLLQILTGTWISQINGNSIVANLTEDEPDYDELLDLIFAADAIHVW